MPNESRERGFSPEHSKDGPSKGDIVEFPVHGDGRKDRLASDIPERDIVAERPYTAGEHFADLMLEEWKKRRGAGDHEHAFAGSQKEWRNALGRSAASRNEYDDLAQADVQNDNEGYRKFKEKMKDARELYDAFEQYAGIAGLDDARQTQSAEIVHGILEEHPQLLAGFSSKPKKEQEKVLRSIERRYRAIREAA